MPSNVLRSISKLIGLQPTTIIVRRFGGRYLWIPKPEKLTDESPLVLTVGLVPAQRLAEKYGGQSLDIPNEVNAMLDLRNEAIVKMFLAGTSISAVAYEFGLDRAMIQKIIDKAGHRAERISRSLTKLGSQCEK